LIDKRLGARYVFSLFLDARFAHRKTNRSSALANALTSALTGPPFLKRTSECFQFEVKIPSPIAWRGASKDLTKRKFFLLL
jgi:hypothetical protein